MKKSVLIFVPNTLEKDKSGYLEGFTRHTDDCQSIYITNNAILDVCANSVGYTGRTCTPGILGEGALFFDYSSGKFKLLSNESNSLVEIIYDYEAFKNSDVIEADDENYGQHIKALTEKLSESRNKQKYFEKKDVVKSGVDYFLLFIEMILKMFKLSKFLTKYSATATHLEDKFVTLQWFCNFLKANKKFSPKIGNVLVARAIDITLGLILAKLCLIQQENILRFFENISREFLSQLKHLLIYLMGSPIGLKLNHAFNHSLGMFFFYHINLSRVFLQALLPFLKNSFGFLVLPAVFGLSFQIAILSDIISLMTFHIYCIYVYVAKLFSLQIKGLSSLWKLFIGRKYNPLRSRVDSCEYSPNQLFIGTLGFTILLFLLPTTTMYYVVFATFRAATMVTNAIFNKTQNLLSVLPFYIVILWIFNSPSIAGTLYINWENSDHKSVQIEAKLSALSLKESLEKFAIVPDRSTQNSQRSTLGKTFHHFLCGTLV